MGFRSLELGFGYWECEKWEWGENFVIMTGPYFLRSRDVRKLFTPKHLVCVNFEYVDPDLAYADRSKGLDLKSTRYV